MLAWIALNRAAWSGKPLAAATDDDFPGDHLIFPSHFDLDWRQLLIGGNIVSAGLPVTDRSLPGQRRAGQLIPIEATGWRGDPLSRIVQGTMRVANRAGFTA